MKSTWILAACALLMVGTAEAAPKRPRHRVVHHRLARKAAVKWSGAETSLVGIRLFDSGVRVVNLYGTPDDIEGVTIGGGAVGGGGGGRNGGFGGGGRSPGGLAPSAGAGGGRSSSDVTIPDTGSEFGFGNETLRQFGGGPSSGEVGAGPALPNAGSGGGGNGPVGPAGAGRGGGMPGGATGGATERVTLTRWIYNRGGSKYGFVVDKFNRVIQIEAIGLQSAKVRTRSGIGFGATFARIMKTYGAPDGYEIAGNTIVVRYLSRKKVAFRLNRLGENKPHVVTGIVVAAGK